MERLAENDIGYCEACHRGKTPVWKCVLREDEETLLCELCAETALGARLLMGIEELNSRVLAQVAWWIVDRMEEMHERTTNLLNPHP